MKVHPWTTISLEVGLSGFISNRSLDGFHLCYTEKLDPISAFPSLSASEPGRDQEVGHRQKNHVVY